MSSPLSRTVFRLGALSEPSFSIFFFGYVLSVVGSGMVPVTLSFAVLNAGKGAGAVSGILMAQIVPTVLFLLVGGVLADRLPRRGVMVSADMLRFLSQGTLAILFFRGTPHLSEILILSALLGIGKAFYQPGRNGLIVNIISTSNLQSANALCAMAESAGQIIGPAFGGVLISVYGTTAAIGIDSISYLVGAISLSVIFVKQSPFSESFGFVKQLAAGWKEISTRTWVLSIILFSSLFNFLVVGPVMVLGAVSFSHARVGALGWGAMMSMLGVGSILGGFLSTQIKPRHPIRVAALLLLPFSLIPIGLALHLPYKVLAGCFFAGGFASTIFNVLWETALQVEIPPDRLSRVAAFEMMGSLCLLPLGYAVAGPMAHFLSLDGALWVSALFSICLVLCCLVTKEVRSR